jgi:hypothetical protein
MALIEVLSRNLPAGTENDHRDTSIRIAGVLTKIHTDNPRTQVTASPLERRPTIWVGVLVKKKEIRTK